MTRGQAIMLSLVMMAVVVSGIAVVHAKNLSRSLFVELQQVRSLKDQADMEWGRLQLELATRGALGRVMEIAHERLQMRVPDSSQIVVVK
ncbi:MAG: cell division protein FtsL [Gammaproteobacteria bacterium]|nr:cell division protein FtsL [Gammaproteobacteria bacterium]MCB1924849.1 cell division protein FtsL [Gammaproteobacteria bacterium]